MDDASFNRSGTITRGIKQLLRRVRGSVLLRNSGWMFSGYGSRVLLQAVYFTLLVRALGVQEYGAFVAVSSLVAIVSPFMGLGAGYIIVMKVARRQALFSEAWGQALFLAFSTGTVLAVLVIGIARFALPRGIGQETILLVTIADLLGPRLADLGSMAFGAFEQFRWNAILQVSSAGFRTVAVVIMVEMIRHPTVTQWVWFYAVSSLLMTAFALGAVTLKLGPPSFRFHGFWQDMKEGLFYSMSLSAQTIYNDIDKTMLGRMSTLSATGLYAAAYRVIDLSCTPLRSIAAAAYPSFFKAGGASLSASFSLGKRIFHRAVMLSLAMTIGMLALAPLLSRILGPGFQQSVEALRWLAVLPVLRSIHVVFGDALTGAGYQRIRAIMQIGVAIFNVGINFWLIRVYSWRGASWSSLASDAALAALTLCGILVLRRREARAAAAQSQFVESKS